MADVRIELDRLYQNWKTSFEYGTEDPNWEDGIGLNNIRKSIMVLKDLCKELLLEEEYPQTFYAELPPELPNSYMVNEAKLKETAIEYAEKIRNDTLYKSIKSICESTNDLYLSYLRNDKWNELRMIHSYKNIPRVWQELAEGRKKASLKIFRKSYEQLVKNIQDLYIKAKNIAEENVQEEITGEESYVQMNLFELFSI